MKSARKWFDAQTPPAWSLKRRPALFVLGAAFSCLLGTFSILGSGCEVPVRWEADPLPVTSTVPALQARWTEVGTGISRFDERLTRDGAAARLVLWRFSPDAKVEWSVATSTAGQQSVSAWPDQDPSILLATNGGYFHPDGSPSGWLRVGGRVVGGRRFDPDRSGLLLLGPQPSLQAGSVPTGTGSDGFQSYPWLVLDGRAAFEKETGQYSRRTFVGNDAAGNWYIGVVPEESLTLYQLTGLLLEIPVAWRSVLNLDGGSSTGLVARIGGQEDRFDSFVPVSYAVVVRRRP